MCVRLWDVNFESRPLKIFPVHEHLRSKLSDLYKNDLIFDKFEVSFSHDTKYIVTGSYDHMFHVLSIDGTTQTTCPAVPFKISSAPPHHSLPVLGCAKVL